MGNTYTDFEKGQLDILNKLIKFIDVDKNKLINENPPSGTPRQITNGGRLQTANRILNWLQQRKNKIN